MIVQPDFLDHWKTQLLAEILQDQMAPIYVIRLWAHCQNRKTHRFPRVNPAITKAICRAPQDADFFEKAMVDSGFIEIVEGDIVAHDWDVANAYLVNSWENGKLGGRPKKKTQTKPTGNPELTQTKPIREEKRREEKKGVFKPPTNLEVSTYAEAQGYRPFDADHFVDFYEAKGWMVGKNKMKDWRAAVRNAKNWESHLKANGRPLSQKKPHLLFED